MYASSTLADAGGSGSASDEWVSEDAAAASAASSAPAASSAAAAVGAGGGGGSTKRPRMQSTQGSCSKCSKSLTFKTASKHAATCWGEGNKASVLAIKALTYMPDEKSPHHWMVLAVPHGCKLLQVDHLLRREWLECCGHLSQFFGARKTKKVQSLAVGKKMEYEYDAGTPTPLLIEKVCTVDCPASVTEPTVVALSDRPWVDCAKCKDACQAVACLECLVGFCEPCSEAHACPRCGQRKWRPTGNSPRNGVCGIGISAKAPVYPHWDFTDIAKMDMMNESEDSEDDFGSMGSW